MLSKVSARNFMSWKSLEFSVSKGVTLVDGWNEDDQRSEGSGKSSVLNAISWGIYGKLPKDVKVNVDDVIMDGEKSCQVVLEFDDGDAIVRSRNPGEVYILQAGAVVKGKDANETQRKIEEFVGCNFETFCQSVYFAQGYDKKFLPSNQSDKGKILSSIQNLQIFDKARKEVMDLLKLEADTIAKLKNESQLLESSQNNIRSQQALVTSFIEDKIKKHEQQLNQLRHQEALLTGHIESSMNQIQSINQQVLAINTDQLDADEADLTKARNEYGTQLSGVTYKKSQIDTIKKSVLAKEAEGRNLATRYQTTQSKLEALGAIPHPRDIQFQQTRERVLDLEKNPTRIRLLTKAQQLQDFIQNPTKICPSCGTELQSADTSHTQKELQEVLSEIEAISVSAQAQADQITKQQEEDIKARYEQSVQLKDEATGILSQLETISEYLDQNKIPDIAELLATEGSIQAVIKQIDNGIYQTRQKKLEHSKLLNQHTSLMNQMGSYTEQHTQIGQSIAQLGQPDVSQDQAKLEALGQQLSKVLTDLDGLQGLLATSVEHSNRLETLKEGFKEIKSYVFTNALNELNFRANQYLSELFETEASIKFTNADQEIESKITLNGHERSIGLLSGGQNRRFNLAVDLALADIVAYRRSSKLDMLILDEYFKDLSEISMEKSLDLLKARKCPVILIEHNSIFKNIVDNTFFVRLKDGISEESRA